ncbi:adenosine receptor A1-like [Diretmus argenteus]
MNVTPTGCPARKFYGFQPHLSGLYIAAELFIALLAVIGNLLVCVAVTRNRKLRTVTNYFLVSLAVADILVGLLAIPCAVLTDLGRPHHDMPLCLLLLSILMVLMQSSILSLLAVAAERYVAILLPFQYQRIMSPRNARLALITTWGVALVSGSVPLIDWHREPAASGLCIFTCVVDMTNMVYFNFFCLLLLPLVVMFIMYGHIFLTVRRQLRRIAVVRGPVAVAGPEDGRAVGSGSTGTEDNVDGATVGTEQGLHVGQRQGLHVGQEQRLHVGQVQGLHVGQEQGLHVGQEKGLHVGQEQRLHMGQEQGLHVGQEQRLHVGQEQGLHVGQEQGLHELRTATSLFLVLFLFMVCWMPIHCINCVVLLCPHCPVPMSLSLAAILLSHANSALNPLLYAYRMRSFRHTLRGMCPWRIGPKHQ